MASFDNFVLKTTNLQKVSPIGIPGINIKNYMIEYFGISIRIDDHSSFVSFLHSEPRV